MTREQQRSKDAGPQESPLIVTSAEFAAADFEAPIGDSSNVDCWTLGSLYQTAASEAEESGDGSALRVFALLALIANIHFKPEDRAEPYGPQSVFDGRRSMIPSDLRGTQSAVISEFVPTIRNPGLRARLADIVWQNNRKVPSMAQLAVDAYCDAVQLVLDGQAEFFDGDRTASGYDGCRMLLRGCQIAHATGWKDPQASRLRTLLGTVIRDAIDRQDHRGFFNVGDVALQFGIGDPANIASNAEIFAISESVDPHSSHALWEVAARAHSSSRNQNERDRCLVAAAETHLTIADAAGGQGMVAAGAIMDAIEALRRLPNTKQQREELKRRLRHAQASVRDEMGSISTTIDLTELIEHARRSIVGVSLGRALGEFADFARSPDPDILRDQARDVADQNVLSSIMPSTVLDDDGKVVAKSPGLRGDENDSKVALHHLIARHESLRRQTAVAGLIEPARQLIWSEHSLHLRDLRLIAAMTPFVPADRVDLVTTGLARFLGGDFFSALHILVPQIEHSLRHILKHAGVDPSSIHSDMTQEDRIFSVILKKDRGSPLSFSSWNAFTA